MHKAKTGIQRDSGSEIIGDFTGRKGPSKCVNP